MRPQSIFLAPGQFAANLVAFVITIVVAFRYLPAHLLADEYVHIPQAIRFANGDWSIDPWLSTWPTLNVVVALGMMTVHDQSILTARLVVVIFAFAAYFGFLRLYWCLHPQLASSFLSSQLRALQFFVSPLVVIYCCTVYTDLPALCWLIWGAVGVMERRRPLLLVAATVSVAFRQSHIVWFVAIISWHCYLSFQESFVDSPKNKAAGLGDNRQETPSFTKRLRFVAASEKGVLAWTVVVSAIWLVIVWYAGGVAFGKNTQVGHQVAFGGIPNMFFAFTVWAMVFTPYMCNVIYRSARNWTRSTALGAIAFVVIALLCYRATLPGNTAPEAMVLIRNQVLRGLLDPGSRILLIALSLLGFFAWAYADMAPRTHWLRWPLIVTALLYLFPFSLIEQRYYIPMFSLFWALRSPVSMRSEWTQLVWSLTLSSALVFEIAAHGRFL